MTSTTTTSASSDQAAHLVLRYSDSARGYITACGAETGPGFTTSRTLATCPACLASAEYARLLAVETATRLGMLRNVKL